MRMVARALLAASTILTYAAVGAHCMRLDHVIGVRRIENSERCGPFCVTSSLASRFFKP